MAADEYPDYAAAYERFRLEAVLSRFDGDFERGINACVECCDRHAASGEVALEWENADGQGGALSFAELQTEAARFANLLASSGVAPGDVVAGLLPRTPELLITILGTWRAGAVYQPLFTAFGPKAISHRLDLSGAKVAVSDMPHRGKLEGLNVRVVTVRGQDDGPAPAGDLDFREALRAQPETFAPVPRRGDDAFMMMATSGTTGPAKGVVVPLRALAAFDAYMRDAIDLRPGDRFWNIADPGWAYGLYYAVAGPLLLGRTTRFLNAPFAADRVYDFILRHRVNNLAGAPTAFRQLIAAGDARAEPVKGRLRVVSSAGEPLNPEVIRWFEARLAAPIYDHYGQTELGMVVNNHHGLRHTIQPGSAGFPMPGFSVAVVDDEGRRLAPNVPGQLAIDVAASPLMWFTGYSPADASAIRDGLYMTGDMVELEPDGRISFVGRNDDVITSSGYRIGPFDVESALVEHPAVVEAAVVGKPDPVRTELVKAFVVLKPGVTGDQMLSEELQQHVRARLSAHAYPREIEYLDDLPKTPSGKVQRFMLRQAAAAEATKVAAGG